MTKWVLLGLAAVTVCGLLFYSRQQPKRVSACRALVQACETAGYKRGPTRQKRQEFRNECFRPLLQTGVFKGTVFDPKVVSDCRARLDRRKSRAKNS